MKKKKTHWGLFLFIILLGATIFYVMNNKDEEIFSSKEKDSSKLPEKDVNEEKIQDILSNMTLDDKIGQMLFIDIQKPSLTESDIALLNTIRPGGFILFGSNFSTYDASLGLIKTVKATGEIPLFIGADEEGGRVERLSSLTDIEVTSIPPMEKVGNTSDEQVAYEVGKIIGQKLNVFGINLDFAPVLDINSNPYNVVIGDRSFGDNLDLVSSMGINVAKGLLKQNVIPVFKHFPGHGDTSTDSHVALPVITKTKEELKDLELIPFQEAIDAGAEIIMVGHLAIPKITGDNTPASLSDKLITGVLKDEMGYQNLVITDSLKMKAITDNYSEKDILKMAINAGVDIILMPENPQNAFNYIKEMVANGEISESRINESVTKILRLKVKYIYDSYDDYLDVSYLNKPEYQMTLDKIK